jgi:DNA N-6-adenine-methyltransferase (Dam)
MNSKHLSNSSKWYTPLEIVNRSKKVLGNIDLDPSSQAQANKSIQADNIFTKRDNALFKDWNIYDSPITVFMNPPSGKYGKHSLPVIFWVKLMDLMNRGYLNHAIVIAFSVEQLQTTQNTKFKSMCDFTMCIPSKRLKFIGAGNSPTHANAIIYVNSIRDNSNIFKEQFESIGKIK